jgi:hypothetical protein
LYRLAKIERNPEVSRQEVRGPEGKQGHCPACPEDAAGNRRYRPIASGSDDHLGIACDCSVDPLTEIDSVVAIDFEIDTSGGKSLRQDLSGDSGCDRATGLRVENDMKSFRQQTLLKAVPHQALRCQDIDTV